MTSWITLWGLIIYLYLLLIMTTTCNLVDLDDALTLLGKKKCNGQLVEIDPASLPNVNDANVCEALSSCDKIKAMEAKDAALAKWIADNKLAIEEIREKEQKVEEDFSELTDKDHEQDLRLDQINTEISGLKTEQIRLINKIEGLGIHVILDSNYLSFDEWCQNVYIPQAPQSKNDYVEGTWYFNTNPSIAADAGVYINVRRSTSTAPYTADDWYRLPLNNDLLAVIWVDPIEVSHPYKGRFEVGLNSNKLADVISKLDSLDLSQVKVLLWDVYLDWVIKESLEIQENLKVGNTTTTKDLVVEHKATISELEVETWHIAEHNWDEAFKGSVSVAGNIEATWSIKWSSSTFTWAVNSVDVNASHQVETWNLIAETWTIKTHTWAETFNGNITAKGNVNATGSYTGVNATLSGKVDTHDLHTAHISVDSAANFTINWVAFETFIRNFCDARYVLR